MSCKCGVLGYPWGDRYATVSSVRNTLPFLVLGGSMFVVVRAQCGKYGTGKYAAIPGFFLPKCPK